MYSIEMAYARMRELQDQANRSRAHRAAAPRARRLFGRTPTKKR
ncbi:hypothetical protein [Streptomyces tubercidicus]|nr:hypothetical protein OG761_20295 [Streptomyces tubercidicus]WSX21314.1 hypothetical protein OG690_16740 [Streptomyces tubercidicus]